MRSGCLILEAAHPASGGKIRPAFLHRTRKAAATYDITHEMLDAAEIRRRYPQFTPQDDEIGYFEPGGGYLNPERCVAIQLERARAMGARMQLGTRVVSLEPEAGCVRILTDRGEFPASQVVVSAGAWTASLLGAPFDRLLAPSRQVMHWFQVEPEWRKHWAEGPVFIWSHGPNSSNSFYGFPRLSGSNTIKAASEQYDSTTRPDEMERTVSPAESSLMHSHHLAGRVRGLRPDATRAATCLYTVTPDSHFLIDHHPESERILVVSPCSGHGFKHSAAIGEVAAQWATDGKSMIDVSSFALSRFSDKAPA